MSHLVGPAAYVCGGVRLTDDYYCCELSRSRSLRDSYRRFTPSAAWLFLVPSTFNILMVLSLVGWVPK